MSLLLWARARLEGTATGTDPEQVEDQHWSRVDAAYEEWRDDQVLNQSASEATATHPTTINFKT